MAYQVIARKFRPQSFSEVTGQEHVTRTLNNAIKRDKIGHAYLFTGLRGVGKTSIARIFAKSLNCEKGPTPTPCQTCENCLSITQGSSIAVREIDGASHNSVDNVRELIESFRTLPPPGSRYKIYIIDEVHMLSLSAFNALLKTLEEPPPFAIFMLATTEVHKIPETILSRCQRHDLRALTQEEVILRLQQIAKEEKIETDQQSLRLISRLSEGSMRDAQTMLERVQSFAEGKIDINETSTVLGIVERTVLFRLSKFIFERQPNLALEEIEKTFSRGIDAAIFLKELVSHWRELLLAKVGGKDGLMKLGVHEADLAELLLQVQDISLLDLQELTRIVREECDKALRSAHPRYALEALVVRLSTRVPVKELSELIGQLKRTDLQQSTNVTQKNVQAVVPQAPKAMSQTTTLAKEKTTEAVAETPKSTATTAEHAFSWEGFVEFITAQTGTRMLVEQLRRVRLISSSRGLLEIQGPEFPIEYLSKSEVQQKLISLLSKNWPDISWKLKLKAVADSKLAAEGSIVEREATEAQGKKNKRELDLTNHPAVKSLQKAFPGTKIETINFKEGKE